MFAWLSRLYRKTKDDKSDAVSSRKGFFRGSVKESIAMSRDSYQGSCKG